MALKAGYYGIKKFIADKLNRMNPGDSFATDAEIAAAADKVRADIAPVLEEAKAPAGGISAGDQFYLNDILYTATAYISAGANIVTTGEGKNADISSNVTEQIAVAAQQLTNSKVNNSVIGNVESAASSAHAYTAGQGFICDGQYRVAKGDGISIGDEITDSNSDVKPLSNILSDLKIKMDTFSGVLDSSHNIVIYNPSRIVLQAYITSHSAPFSIFKSLTTGNTVGQALALSADTAVSGVYYYI